MSDCIFKNHQLWQSGFSRVYSNSCCSCSFKPEILKIGQSSHKMYRNNILIFLRVYDNFKCPYEKSLETIVCTLCLLRVQNVKQRGKIPPVFNSTFIKANCLGILYIGYVYTFFKFSF